MVPAVTVVIATYNCAATLESSLASLVAQDFGDFEACVVGDGCTDRSASVVEGFADPRLRWTNLAQNSGSQAAPNNEGLRRARGRFVAYLGHDDLWFPWHLGNLVEALDSREADFAHALAAVFDADGPCAASGPPPEGTTYRDHFVPPSTWLYRRDLAERIGPWRDPERLGWAVDYDYSRRAALAGARFTFVSRLGVLKFPSSHFRTYAAGGAGPQRTCLAALQHDAGRLERDVLTGLAASQARHPQQLLARVRTDGALIVRAAAVWARRRLIDPRRDAPWVAPVLRWTFQRKRRRVRRSRGLAD